MPLLRYAPPRIILLRDPEAEGMTMRAGDEETTLAAARGGTDPGAGDQRRWSILGKTTTTVHGLITSSSPKSKQNH
jgi:hypothetical protein